jgi:hypothetical protein
MTMRAEKAAEKTRRRGCRMAMSAATRNVLSPISEKMIMVKERMKEWNGWMTPLGSSTSGVEPVPEGVFGEVSKGSSLGRDGGTG